MDGRNKMCGRGERPSVRSSSLVRLSVRRSEDVSWRQSKREHSHSRVRVHCEPANPSLSTYLALGLNNKLKDHYHKEFVLI